MVADDNPARRRFERSRQTWERRVGRAVRRDNQEHERVRNVEERARDAEEDARESITEVHDVRERLSKLEQERAVVTTEPPKRQKRFSTRAPESFHPRDSDPWFVRGAKTLSRSMYDHHRSWVAAIITVLATMLILALIWTGRIDLPGVKPPAVEPPPSPPWNDHRHERRRPRRGEPVAPGTTEQ